MPAKPRAAAPAGAPVAPAGLDLGHLALFTGYAVADAVQAGLAARGFGDLRFSHGFVFQHLVDGPRTIGKLAQRMAVSQQAASKSIAELEGLGYVARTAGDDGRTRAVALTDRGQRAIRTARTVRAGLERRLERRLGARAVAAARATLAQALDVLGGAPAIRARRVLAPR